MNLAKSWDFYVFFSKLQFYFLDEGSLDIYITNIHSFIKM